MKLTIGRVVHYVMPCCTEDHRIRPNAMGEHRPAQVVNIRSDGRPVLMVLLDEHDGTSEELSLRVVGVVHDEAAKLPDSWHWPEWGE